MVGFAAPPFHPILTDAGGGLTFTMLGQLPHRYVLQVRSQRAPCRQHLLSCEVFFESYYFHRPVLFL